LDVGAHCFFLLALSAVNCCLCIETAQSLSLRIICVIAQLKMYTSWRLLRRPWLHLQQTV